MVEDVVNVVVSSWNDIDSDYRALCLIVLICMCQCHLFIPAEQLFQNQSPEESSSKIRTRVNSARHFQYKRAQKLNGQLNAQDVRIYCGLAVSEEQLLAKAIDHYGLSARGTHRILKVARTIADLEESAHIRHPYLVEAMSYRITSN
jgi:magnesium chelatase family protein